MFLPALLLAAIPLASQNTPDLIVLNDGKEIECRVLWEDDAKVVYTKRRRAEEVERAEVQSVHSIERSLRTCLDRYAELPAGDVEGLLELADFCEANELHGEARHLRIRVLTVDEDNERAWTELGGHYSERRGWRLRAGGRYLNVAQLRERVADWRHALEIPTAHFLIKTDAAPERALDVALDVENAYLAFYDLMGKALELYPFEEIPEIHFYASSDDYPKPPFEGQVAWFSRGANELYVDVERAQDAPRAVVAEMAELLLFNSLRRTVGRTGSMPAWVRAGVTQAFTAAFRRDPGRARWDLGQPIASAFRAHAAAEEPLSLNDLLNAPWNSFATGEQAGLYNAQAYTLLHWLARGDDGAHREGLGAYITSAFKGQGARTHLERALDMKAKEIEAAWNAYAAEQAGS